MTRVAINGLGRIGRATLKVIMENPELQLVAVNDIIPIENAEYLLKYDSVYGKYEKEVSLKMNKEAEGDHNKLVIDGEEIIYLSEKDPSSLPWRTLDIDLVFESTGLFTKIDDLKQHIQAGCKKVILSAPAKSDGIPTVVHGVNQAGADENIISTASCTTNCISPVVEILQRRVGIKKAMMTTIHAYTSTQGTVDSPSKKIRRGRAAAINLVPTSTGAAKATTKAIPEMENKFDGMAIRGPVPVGSISDITFITERPVEAKEINEILKEEAGSARYEGIMGVTDDELVSSDIIKDTRASIIDGTSTQVVDGDMLKVMAWYDNEWGYANQMVKEAQRITEMEAVA